MSEGYAVSCSCGWSGDVHRAPERAEREAAGHEVDPGLDRGPLVAGVRAAVEDSAQRVAEEINDSFASKDWLGRAALAWYFDAFRAELASKDGSTSSLRIPSRAELAATAEGLARIAAGVPGFRVAEASRATEIALLQAMLDRGMRTAPVVRIARVAKEQALALITSA